MRTKGDRPLNQNDKTQPDRHDALVSTETETLGTLATAGGPTPTKHNTAPGFDPWRFGTHDVSAELRKEILEKGFPDTPDDKLFTKRHKTDAGEPDGKSESAGADAPDSEPDAARRADTLRLQRKPPLVNPLRAAAPWLVLSAIGVFLLLWLLLGRDGGESPAPDAPNTPATTSASPALPAPPATNVLVTPQPVATPEPATTAKSAPTSSAPSEAPPTRTEPKLPKASGAPIARPAPPAGQPANTSAPASTGGSSRIVPADD